MKIVCVLVRSNPNDTYSPLYQGAGGGFSTPNHGVITDPTENGLIYKPDDGFCGEDTFTYTITHEPSPDEMIEAIATVTIEITCDAELMEMASNDLEDGVVSQANQAPRNTPIESSSAGIILGTTVGALLAIAGAALFASKKRNGPTDANGHPLMVKEFPSSASSGDGGTEASSLTSDHPPSREIQFGGSGMKNLSVAAFLTGEATGASSTRSKRSFFGGNDSAPVSPANSLFSVATSTGSRKEYVVQDTVDL